MDQLAVPREDIQEFRSEVALDLAAFYNALCQRQISDEHGLTLTQRFFPRGRWD